MPQPAKLDRAAVLNAALELLEQAGPDGLSMRSLASSLDVKAPSLYHHFPDKLWLERAIVEEGNIELLRLLRKAALAKPPEPALTAAAQAYRRFALRRPHLYRLMMDRRVIFPPESTTGKELWTFVLALTSPITRNVDDTAHAVALWSFLHGFVMLEQAAMFGASGARGGFDAGLQSLLCGFRDAARSSR